MLIKSGKNGISNLIRKIRNFQENKWNNEIKKINSKNKEKVVILGSGWGGMHFLINIDFKKYDVTLISPRNYFTFTPLLPCLCSGTLSINVCTESVRNFLKKNGSVGNYLQLECTDIIYKDNYITCKDNDNNEMKINYDYLIIAVGAKTNSFNIKGVDKFAFYVKDIDDVLKIRRKFFENLEKSTLPNTTNEEKKNLLHIVIVGGGPTGVEVAGEFADFVNREVKQNYEDIFNFISISIIEGGKNLLPTFTQNISDFTKYNFRNLNINVLTNYYVTEVNENYFYIQSSIDKSDKKKFPYGVLIWASGLAQTTLVNNLLKKIPQQVNNKILNVDSQLKVIGVESNNVYAIGDCKKIFPLQLQKYTSELIDSLHCSKLTSDTLKSKSEELSEVFPQASKYKWDYDKNKKGEMNEQEFHEYLCKMDENYKSPAPTAQNAKQEAYYLSNVFNNFLTRDKKLTVPSFIEKWKGSLAYIGNHQVVAHLPFYEIKGGFLSFTFWKAVYIQLLMTWKSRATFFFDCIRTKLYGRPFIK
ncbi:type II NADH:ubiquinone oxidoreductase, putative [Plasmodium gallinaceum]|uniref:NADH:ubiquinone reductase (non-electrogenic) n=1 Tax=Plasmodium gallinaceum TaxID=5849 RepID=I2FKD5_PLAGA|nr:type II NADH:ubiquinone oxidoreductase, putative [Plasmodium gallinaceum]BAM15620.1 NADH dehydrogenase [Plasmodium gallinaceum]CRG96699.1 type II NADH:ubiquinone oxidoreductase, putative [Plasmodium gallinaceum]